MGYIDEHYAAQYKLPNCVECGEDMLTYNSYKVYEVQLFCANDQCPAFVKTFWVKKTDLEER